jgi:hypothetical protein
VVLLKDMNCPEGNKKGTVTSIEEKRKDELGMAVPRSADNHIHYTSLRLFFGLGRRNKLTSNNMKLNTDYPQININTEEGMNHAC